MRREQRGEKNGSGMLCLDPTAIALILLAPLPKTSGNRGFSASGLRRETEGRDRAGVVHYPDRRASPGRKPKHLQCGGEAEWGRSWLQKLAASCAVKRVRKSCG